MLHKKPIFFKSRLDPFFPFTSPNMESSSKRKQAESDEEELEETFTAARCFPSHPVFKLPSLLPSPLENVASMSGFEYCQIMGKCVSNGCGIDQEGNAFSSPDVPSHAKIYELKLFKKYKGSENLNPTCDAAILTIILEFMDLLSSIYNNLDGFENFRSIQKALDIFDQLTVVNPGFNFSPLYAPCLVELLTLVCPVVLILFRVSSHLRKPLMKKTVPGM
jgi:hypothetical protein